MAQNEPKVLLGFEDELISEKYKNQINFTTNKIGGKPDLPSNLKLDLPICPLCQLPRPLVVQVYAPLENSPFHRTLYLFGCINPNCWNQSESWICIRVQSQEKIIEPEETPVTSKPSVTDWCPDADDWDDNNANLNEENGNLINNIERVSDEDDESCSLEDSIRAGLGNLTVDDRNANNGAFGGAVGRLRSPSATAEIEGDEGEVVSIDSPVMPQNDVVALLQEATPLPPDLCQNFHSDPRKSSLFQFVSSFMSVWEETTNPSNISDRHVKELLQEYQQKTEDDVNLLSPGSGGASAQVTDNNFEKYEKCNPAHGDKMFHHFLSKIQMNPSQILRYCRDSSPLLLYPLQAFQNTCSYCQGEVIFEFQLLPTIIPKLNLVGDAKHCSRLEFGTVLVFTCQKSCWSTDNNFKYETVVMQTEVY